MPIPMPWHSTDPWYCSDPLLGEGDTALNLPSGKGEKYYFMARRSIHTKREYTYQEEWDHQHLFYKLDSISSIFLTKPPKQNIFSCSNGIFYSLIEEYLPIFVLERKKKNHWKKCFTQNNLSAFTLPTFFWFAAKTKPPLSAQHKCLVICNNKKILEKLMIYISGV